MTEELDEKDYSDCFYTYKDGVYEYFIPDRLLREVGCLSLDLSKFKPKEEA